MENIIVLILVPVIFAEVKIDTSGPTITINDTTLYGTTVEVNGTKVDRYLGIPFAKPPLGPLRFAPPVKLDLPKGPFYAQNRPNTCYQYLPSDFEKTNPAAKIWINNTIMSEDCLYLNVWKPNKSESGGKLAVMVWIFGGGFFSGSSTLDIYDGSVLAAMENVILVSMQYRLGPFGFLYFKGQVDGNMGLKDQQMALQWVHDNIGNFGGDPNKVTIFGESAGAVSVGIQYLSPSSRSLFQRMILESASPLLRWALFTKDQAHETGITFIKITNCSNINRDRSLEIECLRNISAPLMFDYFYQLSAADAARRARRVMVHFKDPNPFLSSGVFQYFDVYMRPVMDGDFLPDCPTKILQELATSSQYQHPQVLFGTNDKEGMYWLFYGLGLENITFLYPNGTVNLPSTEEFRALGINFYELILSRFMSMGQLIPPFPSIVTLQYDFNSPEVPLEANYESDIQKDYISSNLDFLYRFDSLSGEMDFICGTFLFARLLANMKDSKLYAYNFMHKSLLSPFPNWTGAMHGYELEYVFGMPFSTVFTSTYYNFTTEEVELSRRMMKYWTNFAKTGDPNEVTEKAQPQNEKWPAYDGTTQMYLQIDLQSDTVMAFLRDKGCTFWNDVYSSLMRLWMRRFGYPRPEAVCPHLEFDLYPVNRLSDFVEGTYYDASSRTVLSVVLVLLNLLLTLIHW